MKGRGARSAARAVAATVALAMTMALGACGQAPLGASEIVGPRIVIGVTYDQPAMGLRKGSQYSGLNVEVAEYVARRLGYASWQIVWENAPEAGRDDMLDDGDVDMVTGMYVDDDRLSATHDGADLPYDFAGSYLDDSQGVMTLKSATDITSVDDLGGRKACVIDGSATGDELRRRLDGHVTLVAQPGATQCATALLTGMVDAVSAPRSVLRGLAASEGGTRVRVLDAGYARGRYGIGLRKGSDRLSEQVKAALDAMRADGSLNRALRRTLGNVH
ncbi:transporter substrate-binding domain-containing protein [Bifidobacterium sp. 82T24]|uniref:transporter substrate-binding domain-containing protein n=1 Tax=Bifidobacterium pluvialisilvae TaxID=2834436 RepID=UPI001C581CF3|nr:transporter substrate-binding domain-containing protein [Bifidobacterium pluvialisilvae]MBW3087807.1 transporter substrate-binding domain-containing protein [Bifidobacterium pluvialisilvae]